MHLSQSSYISVYTVNICRVATMNKILHNCLRIAVVPHRGTIRTPGSYSFPSFLKAALLRFNLHAHKIYPF